MILQKKTLEKLRNIINEESEYRKGSQLVSFFNNLGFNDSYSYGQNFPSRWVYTDEKLNKINGTPELDKCIKNVFTVVNFVDNINKLDKLINDFNKYLAFDKWAVRRHNDEIKFEKLDKVIINEHKTELKEDDFLKQEFVNLNVDLLKIESAVSDIIKSRLKEIEICLQNDISLSSIFLIGSTLEGVLLGVAQINPQKYNQSKSAPKYKDSGKIKSFQDWTLSNFIDVSYDVGMLNEDVKKFSHVIRDFRNYIHPYQQMCSNFHPDKNTVKICFQVLKAAISQLSNNQNR